MTTYIHTGMTAYLYRKTGGYRAFIMKTARDRWQLTNEELLAAWELDEAAGPLEAKILRSNWCVKCDVCGETFLVDPEDPVFWCPNCLNRRQGGKARRIIFPDADVRAEIEAVLGRRADPKTRNWKPEETLSDLRQQNIQHGEF